MKSERRVSEEEFHQLCKRFRNWGRWGEDDEIGTLNFVEPSDIVAAARLVRRGKVFSLAYPFDGTGPQTGKNLRYNTIHYMIHTGTDAVAGCQEQYGHRFADDAIILPTQTGTQWDALSHVFYGEQMYNGYDARLVDTRGARRNGIEKTADRMVGRGVLLDVARELGMDALPDGYPITQDELDRTARSQGVDIRKGDFVLVRTGQIEDRLKSGQWNGYASGVAPGLSLNTAEWIFDHSIAAIASDTYAVEVRPEATDKIKRPWHWVVIPNMGLTVGEIFMLGELAADCAQDSVYEFMFVAPPLPITGGVGSPINPLAIK